MIKGIGTAVIGEGNWHHVGRGIDGKGDRNLSHR